jgi:hypothetical protein
VWPIGIIASTCFSLSIRRVVSGASVRYGPVMFGSLGTKGGALASGNFCFGMMIDLFY